MKLVLTLLLLAAANAGALAHAAEPPARPAADVAAVDAATLDATFSCSVDIAEDARRGGGRSIYADNGEVHLRGDHIDGFRWESALFLSTHGFDCSIDDTDGLEAERMAAQDGDGWRLRLQDGRAARTRRGYDADHGFNCTIRLLRQGAELQIVPSCPALCGSRENFSTLSVNLKTGQCSYDN